MNPQTPTKTTPKDFFLHLGATVALYASVIALVNLLFSIIDYSFPDELSNYFSSSSIAWPISMLIVLVPTLYIIGWIIRKDIIQMPEKDSLWIRRWRIFLTLFLTGATIIGDLIVLINTYLNGEISERLIYKVLAILILFGVIFAYYLLERIQGKRKVQTVLAWVGAIIVLASIVGGFLIVGSPTKQRAVRFDNQRVNDLQSIQYQIVSYWQSKSKLPATLSALNDPLAGTTVSVDPENQTEYGYSIKSDKSFELCATFSLTSEDARGKGSYGYNTIYQVYPGMAQDTWKYTAGRSCFTRTIDPEMYPPIPKIVMPI